MPRQARRALIRGSHRAIPREGPVRGEMNRTPSRPSWMKRSGNQPACYCLHAGDQHSKKRYCFGGTVRALQTGKKNRIFRL